MDFALQLAGLPARDLIATAQRAEELGYAAIYVPDHFAYERQGGGGLDEGQNAWEALAILGAIAASTKKVRLGGHVLCNLFRHPGSTAQAMSTLDHVSGGRVVLGIGSGWTRAEFEMMGMHFPDIKPRLRMLDEAVRIVKQLWTEERTTFRGEFYNLSEAISVPKPVQKPHPPVLLGGSGKGLLRIAAREADIVNVISETGRAGTVLTTEVAKVTEDAFKAKLDFVRAEAKAAGRDPAKVTLSTTVFMPVLSATTEEARGFAEMLGGVFGVTADQVLRMPLALIGTPDEWVAELKRREREWGIEHLILGGTAGAGLYERIAAEIMPRL